MRDEKRKRIRDDEIPLPKKKREESPPMPNVALKSHVTSSSKTRGHLPVSERQQFALLKLMETKKPGFDHAYRSSSLSLHHSASHSSHGHGGHSKRLSSAGGTSVPPLPNSRGDFALMRASKKGDLLTVKMLVKEGADVNRQDSSGRTALHECCAQNHSNLVSYLLRHNANTSVKAIPRCVGGGGVGGGTGDTPLHEAARNGHVRIIRFLLQHGADTKATNSDGELPIELCPNEATQMALKQKLPATGAQPSDAAYAPSVPRSPQQQNSSEANDQSSSQIHGSRRTSMDEVPARPPRRATPEIPTNSQAPSSSSSSSCPQKNPNSPGGDRVTTQHNSPSTTKCAVTTPPGNLHHSPRPPTKKDPYAFDDEEAEPPTSGHEVATANTSGVATATGSTSASSPTPPTAPAVTRQQGGSTIATISTPPSGSLQTSGEASFSPGGGGGAPSLKLRFAIESGHYTLLEQDQQQSQMETANSPTGDIDTVPQNVTQVVVIPGASDDLETTNDAPDGVVNPVDAVGGLLLLEEDAADDDDTAPTQKVPPLRIKLAAQSPSHTSSAASQQDQNTTNDTTVTGGGSSICTTKNDLKPDTPTWGSEHPEDQTMKPEEPVGDGHKVPENEPIEDGKHSASAQQPQATSVCSGSGGGGWRRGKIPKNASSAVGGSKPGSSSDATSNMRSRHVDSSVAATSAATSGDVKGKDSEGKIDEAPKSRSSRTLRSHTAAQRERGEREKPTDISPPKKRKYRPGGVGNNNHGNGSSVSDQGDSVTGNVDVETLDGESHGDNDSATNTANEQPRPSSAASTTDNAGDMEEQGSPSTANDSARRPKVFDDPSRPSASGWGENPYERAADLNIGLTKLIGKLVELQPKEPAGYHDYLLVTREYLLADRIPQNLTRRSCPSDLPPPLAELFDEQEEERYAQTLKHQSEREQLRLCAEQSVLRAQTRATIALANQPRPLSFCSVMALKGFTYLPPFENRDEESVRDRFKARTLIGWLQDIKDNFHLEKKKLLCRQLHEAESLMMVQKLDWEVKLKELHFCDYGANIFEKIQHVPPVEVPNDFPLFVHDPIQRSA